MKATVYISLKIFLYVTNVYCSFESSVNFCPLTVYNQQTREYFLYDFSSLDTTDFIVDDNADNVDYKVKMYFSFCKKSIQSEHLQDTFICVKNSSSNGDVIFSAGSIITNGTYENSNNDELLLIELSGGSKCEENVNYSSVVYILCDTYDINPILIENNKCQLTFKWVTTAACVANKRLKDVSRDCILKTKNYRFNFGPLRNPSFYTVPSAYGINYEVNICGSIVNGSCLGRDTVVCEVHKNKTAIIKASGKMELIFNYTTLTVSGILRNNSLKGAVIIFSCAENDSPEKIELMNYEKVPFFEVKTQLACIPNLSHCSFFESGKYYDIMPLHKSTSSWEVDDLKGNKYFFNVCGKIKKPSLIDSLEDQHVAAYLWVAGNNSTVLLGREHFQPKSDLNLIYIGGSRCEGENLNESINSHSLIIELVCNQSKEQLYFKNQTFCKHYLGWITPAACSLEVNEGYDCKTSDPYFHYEFDFNKLTRTDNDYIITVPKNNEIYMVNVCKNVNSNCNDKRNVGVCWKDNTGQLRAIGETSYSPKFRNGRIILEMTGESCRAGGPKSTVTIHFLCEHEPTLKNRTEPEFKKKNVGSCEFDMHWYTDKACVNRIISNCVITDKTGNFYDLTPLRRTGNNYIISHSDENHDFYFILNVCHSVNNEERVICKSNDGICLFNLTAEHIKNRYISLGIVSGNEGPFLDNGVLKLQYKYGAVCLKDTSSSIISVIEFYCSKTDSEPEFVSKEVCSYKFRWYTPAACIQRQYEKNLSYQNPSNSNDDYKEFVNQAMPNTRSNTNSYFPVSSVADKTVIPITKPESIPVSTTSFKYLSDNDCFVINPSTNYRFDLSPLRIKDWIVQNNKGKNIVFSVCQPLRNTAGSNNIGCLTDGENHGNADNKLKFHEDTHSLLLLYTNGEICVEQKNKDLLFEEILPVKTKETLIEFKCSILNNNPVLFEQSNKCLLHIIWETPYACEKKENCYVTDEDGDMYDLTPLIKNYTDYMILNGSNKFFINVCDKLVNSGNSPYSSEKSSACVINDEEILSLGIAEAPPEVVSEGEVVLKYKKGSPCPGSNNQLLTSQISFICSKGAGNGKMQFHSFSQALCQYNFMLITDIVCLNKTKHFPVNSCIIVNSMNQLVNLSSSVFENIKNREDRKSYTLNLCKNIEGICPNGIICQSKGEFWLSFGDFSNVKFNMDQDMIWQYKHKENCHPNDVNIDMLKQLYCGLIPDAIVKDVSLMRTCLIPLKGFNLTCVQQMNERKVLVSEEISFGKIFFTLVAVILAVVFSCALLKCRKIRKCFMPSRSVSSTRTNSVSRTTFRNRNGDSTTGCRYKIWCFQRLFNKRVGVRNYEEPRNFEWEDQL